MKRKFFSDVLQSMGVDYLKEYERLYVLFYANYNGYSIAQRVADSFYAYPFKDTCLSFEDFNTTFHFVFEQRPTDFDVNYLVNFCEYCFNICFPLGIPDMTEQLYMVLEKIGYKYIRDEKGMFFLVEKDSAATSVSEIVPQKLAYHTLMYNHHSLKGDLNQKRSILKDMADYLEPRRNKLSKIDSDLEDDIFYLLNKFNIRHNNTEPGKSHNPLLDNMKDKELEQIYDDTYQLWLLAILQLDNVERKQRIEEYKAKQGR